MGKRIIVAIDGPAGAGKSTVARRVADRLGFTYVDTGAMYRAVALWALRRGVAESDMHRLEQLASEAEIEFRPGSKTVILNGEDVTEEIRTPQVSAAASTISALPGVRRALVEKQRRMASEASVVMEGRDIGSVVFPEAQVKVFLDAAPATRADRRIWELSDRDGAPDAASAARDLEERDRRDRTRAESPLLQAPDAAYLDTTSLSIEEVEESVLKLVRERTANGKEVMR
ncbi:MAG: (d)CMP kinase [Acidobacteria bacterium]|nr:(d)CMP kinase [Acidobacteriota bacterium]MBI3280008.1 (d)CMP kinase [Acidobacteriota bacterium]